MIYLKQAFDLHPATPATRDRFVEAVRERLLPAHARHGARLVAAWFAHEAWFSQVLHVTEFDDLAAFGAWREAARTEEAAAGAERALAALAVARSDVLLEPLGPIPPATLHTAIEASRAEPAGVHTFAILELVPDGMERFASMLALAKDRLPILACWREVAGHPTRVIDLWRGDTGATGYRPSDARQDAFFEPLRQVAPRERMMRLHPLPYSPLR